MKINANLFSRQENEPVFASRIDYFFRRFHIGSLAHQCRIRKTRGVSPLTILMTLFALPFTNQNIFRGIVNNPNANFGKDAVYDFLRSERFNWRRLLLLLSAQIVMFLKSLTPENREKVLIIDDSTIKRLRSKHVELLARVYDHCEGKFFKGFRLLSLCWSDGSTTVPLDFALLSSANKKNRFQEITKQIDKRTSGFKRRTESMVKKTELLEPMVKRALASGIKANYLLMDSWFSMPSIIATLRKHLPVICMLRRTTKVMYIFAGRRLTLDGIYRNLKKRRGRARILTSTLVTMTNGEKAKIVFVRDRHKTGWMALISTDLELADAEIIRIYGKRWDIEVFFRMSKQFLGLENEIQARDYDSLIAHTTIALMRYMFLSLEQRFQDDPRTLGLLFHAFCDELQDITFIVALQRILTLALDELRTKSEHSENIYQAMIETIFSKAINYLGLKSFDCQRTQALAA
jgi:hypothetical protein